VFYFSVGVDISILHRLDGFVCKYTISLNLLGWFSIQYFGVFQTSNLLELIVEKDVEAEATTWNGSRLHWSS